MQIFIKTLSGTKQSFNFEPDNTILQIKNALQEKEGILVDQIKLIFGGKQLADENKISDYKLEAGSTLHMVLQLRGVSPYAYANQTLKSRSHPLSLSCMQESSQDHSFPSFFHQPHSPAPLPSYIPDLNSLSPYDQQITLLDDSDKPISSPCHKKKLLLSSSISKPTLKTLKERNYLRKDSDKPDKYNSGRWTNAEKMQYQYFMIHNIQDHETWSTKTYNKKRASIFVEMSRMIRTRSPGQCRSHDQKMREKQQYQYNSRYLTPTNGKNMNLTPNLRPVKVLQTNSLLEEVNTDVPSESPVSVNVTQDPSSWSPTKKFVDQKASIYFSNHQVLGVDSRLNDKWVVSNVMKAQNLNETRVEGYERELNGFLNSELEGKPERSIYQKILALKKLMLEFVVKARRELQEREAT